MSQTFRTSRSKPLFVPYHFNKDSKTQAQFAFDTDINNIIAGMTAPLPVRDPVSTTEEMKKFSPDMYEQALFVKAEAENRFFSLPSNVREFFENNPKNMLEFVSNPENTEKCIELGLMISKEASEFQKLQSSLDKLVDKIDRVNNEKTVDTVTSEKSQRG